MIFYNCWLLKKKFIILLVFMLFLTTTSCVSEKNIDNDISIHALYEIKSVQISLNSEIEYKSSAEKYIEYFNELIKTSKKSERNLSVNSVSGEYRVLLEYPDEIVEYTIIPDEIREIAFLKFENEIFLVDYGKAKAITSLVNFKKDISFQIDEDARNLFNEYDMELAYQINKTRMNINSLEKVNSFESNAYYFAYNNELSRAIGLDFLNNNEPYVDVYIYRVETMIKEKKLDFNFEGNGIILKQNDQIVGSFINDIDGHIFQSLDGRDFKDCTGKNFEDWLFDYGKYKNSSTNKISNYSGEVLEKYFEALDNRDFLSAMVFVSEEYLLSQSIAKSKRNELFTNEIYLPFVLAEHKAEYINSIENIKHSSAYDIELKNNADSIETGLVYKCNIEVKYKRGKDEKGFWEFEIHYFDDGSIGKISKVGHDM